MPATINRIPETLISIIKVSTEAALMENSIFLLASDSIITRTAPVVSPSGTSTRRTYVVSVTEHKVIAEDIRRIAAKSFVLPFILSSREKSEVRAAMLMSPCAKKQLAGLKPIIDVIKYIHTAVPGI